MSFLEHLHLWQKRNFQSKTSDHQPTFVANIHRNNIAQIYVAINNSNTTEHFENILLDEESESYYKVVDDIDHLKGLNNYAERALSIASRFLNHSESWKSELTYDDKQLQSVQHELSAEMHCDELLLDDARNKGTLKLLQPKNSKPCASDFAQMGPFNSARQSLQTANDNNQDGSKVDIFLTSHISKSTNDKKETKRKFEEMSGDDDIQASATCFKSAREQLCINQKKKFQHTSPQEKSSYSGNKKLLGSRPRNQCYSKFVPPNRDQKEESGSSILLQKCVSNSSTCGKSDEASDPRLKGIDPQLIELVLSEIMDHGPPIDWDDIAGLEFAKETIKEVVIWPMLRPDIFTGLRGPPKGILLFGPPGTGKTLIGKCIANQSGATFFSISASSLTSKWIGQAEKMVRALFAVANIHQPAVIFIDEIDSLLSQRSDSEHESSRRIKTEFFVQLDGATTSSEDRILVVGATNRPQEIDEAARRRLVKRLYIPLPDDEARKQIVVKLMKQQSCSMTEDDIWTVVSQTNGYSGADVTNLCKDAALGPIRSLQVTDINRISKEDVRPINMKDFKISLQRVKASVSQKDLVQYQEWNKIFGCGVL